MTKRERRSYVKAMLKAIKLAAWNPWREHKPTSKADGLRVIRTFEKVNKIKFDPFDELHVDTITGNGHHENMFRRQKMLFGRWRRQNELNSVAS